MQLPPIDRKLLYVAILVLVVVLAVLLMRKLEPPVLPLDQGVGGSDVSLPFGAPEPLLQKDVAFDRMASTTIAEPGAAPESGDQRVIRTGSLNLIVATVEEAADAITERTKQLGGVVESSQISRDNAATKTGYVTVRVPDERFDDAMTAFAEVALEVESRSSNASDVTRQFVDLEARLSNARAEEEQYQTILARAQSVEDILNVSRALSEVRGRIEQMQAELNYLSSQTDMSTISIFLNAEGDVEVFGVRWRPLVATRQAARELLEKLADAGNTLIRLVILLPVLLLWLVVFSLIAYLVWKIIAWLQRFVARRSSSSF